MKKTKLLAKSFVLEELLQYHTNAIVSREIVNKNTGTVTLFAFDKGQGLSEHTAPFDALVFIADAGPRLRFQANRTYLKKAK